MFQRDWSPPCGSAGGRTCCRFPNRAPLFLSTQKSLASTLQYFPHQNLVLNWSQKSRILKDLGGRRVNRGASVSFPVVVQPNTISKNVTTPLARLPNRSKITHPEELYPLSSQIYSYCIKSQHMRMTSYHIIFLRQWSFCWTSQTSLSSR